MDHHAKADTNAEWLPDDAQPCIWMAAGLLSYKLCDRAYDCDHCPLYAALLGKTDPEAQSAGKTCTAGWTFPDDRHYSKAHVWALPQSGGELRIGVDSVVTSLIGRVTAVVLPRPGTRVTRGSASAWLRDDDELIALASPVTGTVVRFNDAAQARPSLVRIDPYWGGWLLDVVADRPRLDLGLHSASEMEELTSRQLDRLVGGAGGVAADTLGVGPTMADGGNLIPDLRRVLGSARFRLLLSELLQDRNTS